ncbi:xylulokinase [Nakamurella silvestris]|nr:xylulokinase [Nakamurella silvestris]
MTQAQANDGSLVAGIDSSTQSCKVLLLRAEDGALVEQASAPHPDGTEVHPDHWWNALETAGGGILDRAAAIGVGAQQHGMVALDEAGAVVRPALLWNDLRSAPQTAALIKEFGGAQATADSVGSVLAASFTVTKLRWLAENEPENAARVAGVLLPHDWLTWQLGGRRSAPATDRGDASGTGYFATATGQWRPDLLRLALGHDAELPLVAAPNAVVGRTGSGAVLSAGTGDNMAAALGLGLVNGDVAVSIGTSGAAFAVTDSPIADPSGLAAGFADAAGGFLPLSCTINAAKILDTTARLLGVDHQGLSDLALRAEPGANGLTFLPYLDGERTPNRPDATGVMSGITSSTTAADLARAAVEGLLCSLADAVDALGLQPRRILLIGGGAKSEAVRRIAPSIWGVPVDVPEPGEYVGRGAARQAAWALAGGATPPEWPAPPAERYEADVEPLVRDQYAQLRDASGL